MTYVRFEKYFINTVVFLIITKQIQLRCGVSIDIGRCTNYIYSPILPIYYNEY